MTPCLLLPAVCCQGWLGEDEDEDYTDDEDEEEEGSDYEVRSRSHMPDIGSHSCGKTAQQQQQQQKGRTALTNVAVLPFQI
jgi:hypothetical protein